jgi:penicillin-binding protein 1C
VLAEILTEVTRPDLPSIWQSVVDMPIVAWKTGTSYGRRDAWAVGYSPQLVAGIWIGNFDSTPVAELNGANTAGPILFSILKRLHDPQSHYWYIQPRNLDERQVCALSGLLPGDACESLISDYYLPESSSATRCNIHHLIVTDEEEQVELCSLCRNTYNWKLKTVTEYPAEIERWFAMDKSSDIRPPHNPDCIRFSKGEKPILLSPQHMAEYWINPGLALDDQLIAFKAAAFSDVDSLYWFVSGAKVAKCSADEPSFWAPQPGDHPITCMDDKGRYSTVSISIR